MRPVFSVSTLLIVLLASSAVRGGSSSMYVVDSVNNLATVDVQTGQAELIGGTAAQFTDIAFDADGRLFGITPIYFYEIDPTNGWSTLIGSHGYGGSGTPYGLDSLVFGPGNIFYAAGNDILISIDPLTGAGATLGTLSGFTSAGDLAVTADERLVLTTDAGVLVRVHTDGSGAAAIGSIPYTDVYALAGDADGSLYGIRSTNDIVSIDPGSGQAAIIGTVNAGFSMGYAWGASFPDHLIPEPATMVLCVVGVCCLGLRRRQTHL